MKYEIERFNPCEDALEFRKKYKTFRVAWNNCPRGDWMLWLAEKLQVDRRLLVLTGGHCANTVRHLMGNERSTKGVDACIAYGEGRIGEDELDAAMDAAWAVRAAAWDANQNQNADICRKFMTQAVMEKIKSL